MGSEHHKSDLVWFKGNNAQTYFYQSELPYAQFDTTTFGYLVAPSVTAHKAIGVGVYSIFTTFPLDTSKPSYEAAMSCPVESNVNFVTYSSEERNLSIANSTPVRLSAA